MTILTEDDGVPGSKIEKDPDNYTVKQLKRWLKCRGLKQTGKREKELYGIVCKGLITGFLMLVLMVENGLQVKLLGKMKNLMNKKDAVYEIVTVPVIPTSGWRLFPSRDIPTLFSYGHIYYYALESIKTVHLESEMEDETDCGLGHMTYKPLKNGRKYVDSGFVHDMIVNKTSEHYFLRAHVYYSIRNELPHNVLMILSVTSGAVVHASCHPCKVAALGRCSHVVAVLLSSLDHLIKMVLLYLHHVPARNAHGTRERKGRKTQSLSSIEYPTKRKKSAVPVADFDPRPAGYRQVRQQQTNGYLRDLQSISSTSDEISMWETQFQFLYDYYQLDEIDVAVLTKKVKIFCQNLTVEEIMQLPGTEEQSQCQKWYSERWLRITASRCLAAWRIGRLIRSEAPNAAVRAYKFIKTKVWQIDNPSFQSQWMKYGLESEPKAIQKYKGQTGTVVSTSGLWVNPKYPFLGCSPDGLAGQDGIIENQVVKNFQVQYSKQHNFKSKFSS